MLVFCHLQGYESGVELLQAMEEDDFAREHIVPKEGIKKSAFYGAISERGLLQLQEIFQSLYAQAKNIGYDLQWFDWYASIRGKKLWEKKYQMISEISWNE